MTTVTGWATVAAAFAGGALALAPAALAAECAPKPGSPAGYQVTAVGADRVDAPATTPPIAILDSGIGEVPELAGRVQPGINVATGGQNVNDIDGHGTAVATVAAGQAGGVRGISPTSPVIPIKILDIRGETSADDVVAGIDGAVARGAKVINISAAATAAAPTTDDRKVLTAIERAVSKGVVVVAPSGNEGRSGIDIPAIYPHVLAVGATDESGLAADFSNTGLGLDFVAPGANIITAAPSFICSTGYQLVNGTSFAAPAASGAAALVQAARPELDATQVTDVLRLARGTAWSATLGFGLLDVPAALAAPAPPSQPTEVDDDVYWVKRAPLRLSSSRRKATVASAVATHTDPADVYRVKLRRGDRLSATMKAAGTSLRLSLWDSKTASFEITSGRRTHRVASGTRLRRVRIKESGVYYVAVGVGSTTPQGVPYTLALTR